MTPDVNKCTYLLRSAVAFAFELGAIRIAAEILNNK
jgi:hypothetical protein